MTEGRPSYRDLVELLKSRPDWRGNHDERYRLWWLEAEMALTRVPKAG